MPGIILFITAMPINGLNVNYSTVDRILQNIHHPNEYEIYYSGQDTGKNDDFLIQAVENRWTITIFHRKKQNESFIYLGKADSQKIIKNRNSVKGEKSHPRERLQLHFIINHALNIKIPRLPHIQGSGKYKKDVFAYLNLPLNICHMNGFYKID